MTPVEKVPVSGRLWGPTPHAQGPQTPAMGVSSRNQAPLTTWWVPRAAFCADKDSGGSKVYSPN